MEQRVRFFLTLCPMPSALSFIKKEEEEDAKEDFNR